MGDAIAAWRAAPGGDRQWRTHFHVPIFLDDLGLLRTTRSGIVTAMAVQVRTPLSDHLEIETYTWDVLPAHLKTGDIINTSPARSIGCGELNGGEKETRR